MDSNEELEEKDPGPERNSRQAWFFIFALLAIFFLFWGLSIWQKGILSQKRLEFAFYDVTNREFSLFWWQNPDMDKDDIPFFKDDLSLLPDQADQYVVAPSEILFRYHVWNRLIGNSLAPRPIYEKEFAEFLVQNKEWLPRFWPKAPHAYAQLVEDIFQKGDGSRNVQKLPYSILPYEARLAFQGWINYTHEWNEIINVSPSKEEMAAFLKEHPTYGPTYWQNILKKTRPHYLESFSGIDFTFSGDKDEKLNEEELSIFLKIAFYNFVIQK